MNVDYIKLLKDNLNDFGEWKEIDNEIAQCLLSKFGGKNYLTRIFNPANDKEKIKIELERTETYLGKKLSGEFLDFLKQTDGFFAYSGSLEIQGLGISSQNWCIISDNPKFLFKDTLNKIYPSFYVIGSFCCNFICLSSEKKGVFIVDKETCTILMEFDSLYDCIEYALKFLRPCYDDEGYIYPEYPTLIQNEMKTKKIC
jgi:hypothetical protein